jgi:hypothetical protein
VNGVVLGRGCTAWLNGVVLRRGCTAVNGGQRRLTAYKKPQKILRIS